MPPSRVALRLALVVALALRSCGVVGGRGTDQPHMHSGAVTTGAVARAADGVSQPLTECAACRDHGSCALAFRGLPGQFCHTVDWSGLACCCPQESACISTRPSQCLCREVPAPYTTPGYSATTVYLLVAALLTTIIVIGILATRGTSSGYGSSGSTGSSGYYRRNSPTVVYQPVYAGDSGGASYGSTTTFSGDSGGGGATFSGDTGSDRSGGTFAGDS